MSQSGSSFRSSKLGAQHEKTLDAILTPTETEMQNQKLLEENKSDLTSEGPDAAYEGAACLKWLFLGFGLVEFLTFALTASALGMYKYYNVTLGSSLPNLGERESTWNLSVFIGIAVPAIGLFRMLATIGCWWTPAATGMFQQRVGGLRAVISLFSAPTIAWTILQMMGATDVFIIIEAALCRLAVPGFQHASEMYNRYWMDAIMSEAPTETADKAPWSVYQEAWAFVFLAGFWWVAIFYAIETSSVTYNPLPTAQTQVPAIANHVWITITTIVVTSVLDVVAYALHTAQYWPNYLDYKNDDKSWKGTAIHNLRKPNIQEGLQLGISFTIEVYLLIIVFTAMYT